tara:strand:+ start:671 stop:1165 length:495 start_codon:yes stop_codon:yes gene_type:complete
MTILLKNKHTLIIDEFKFKCCIGKNGKTSFKKEGDLKTPKGTYSIDKLYYRSDRLEKPRTQLKTIKIKKKYGWCDDINFPTKYNKPMIVNSKIRHEKLHRKDSKYDLLIPIKYNFTKPIIPNGSCIFLHLTKNYKPTEGCIALKKNDFLILLKIIKPNTKIIIN